MRKLRSREIFSDSQVTLLVVESVDMQRGTSDTHCHCHGNLQPVAVVVRTPEQSYAMDMDAKPVDLSELIQDLPELTSLY